MYDLIIVCIPRHFPKFGNMFLLKCCQYFSNGLERLFHKRFAGPRYEINIFVSPSIVFWPPASQSSNGKYEKTELNIQK